MLMSSATMLTQQRTLDIEMPE